MGRKPIERKRIVDELIDIAHYYYYNGNVIKEKTNIPRAHRSFITEGMYMRKKLIVVKQIEGICNVIVYDTNTMLKLLPLRKKYQDDININIQVMKERK